MHKTIAFRKRSFSDQERAHRVTLPPGGVNERFYTLDFIRLIAMLLMIQGHTLDALVSKDILNTTVFPWSEWHFLRGLTAPIFLMISGAVHVFANKRDATGRIPGNVIMRRISWSITLIGIGYLMVFPANSLGDLQFVSQTTWDFFWRVNILQLCGVSLLMMIVAFCCTRSSRTVALVSLGAGGIIIFITPFLHNVHWFDFLPSSLANYMTHSQGSLFPLFPYASYMFFGVSLGAFLQNIPAAERNAKFSKLLIGSGCALILFATLASLSPISIYPRHNYYLSNPGFVLLRIGCSFFIMSLLSALFVYTKNLGVYYSRLGKKSLHIYIFHLILLYGAPWFHGLSFYYSNSLTITEGAAIAAGIIATSLGLAWLLDYQQRHARKTARALHLTTAAAVVYVVLF